MLRKSTAFAVLLLVVTVSSAVSAASDSREVVPLPALAFPGMATTGACSEPTQAAATPGATAGKTIPPADADRPKVVFQINQADTAPTILRFVTNYLIAEPAAKVVVVGYGGGVDFMLKGAKDAAGKPYADQVQALSDKGVVFKVCNNTLKARNLTADAVIPAAAVVPGAVNEIIRLQTREGYAYFRH